MFVEAARAHAELEDGHGDRVSREVAIEGHERAALVAEWLNELVYIAETEDLVPEGLVRIELSDEGVAASVRRHRGHPRHLVKGATYHRLSSSALDAGSVRRWCSMSELARASVRGFRQIDDGCGFC